MGSPGGFTGLPLRLSIVLLALGCLRCIGCTPGVPPPLIFSNLPSNDTTTALPLGATFSAPIFERKYPTGWLTSPIILNTHVETSQLYQLLTQRKRTHYPGYITAHTVEYPVSIVLFNILWIPNANNWAWTLALNLDGAAMQQQLDNLPATGMKPRQIDSCAFLTHGTIYYSAIFIAKEKWLPGTEFNAVFGTPQDQSYCCGPDSRWGILHRAGYKPLSVSVTQDPVTHNMFIADVWNTRDVQYWQGGIDKTSGEVQSLLASLAPPLVPVFLKAYRKTFSTGSFQILYSFVAEGDSSIRNFASTVDISRSGIELLAKTLKYPPLFVTSFYMEGEVDPQDSTSGDMYSAVWQAVTESSTPLGVVANDSQRKVA